MHTASNLDLEKNSKAATTLGIYVQVPFCQTKCTYCNFHTGVVSSSLYRPYVEGVCREITQSRALRDVTVDTVYLGGGTPSLLEPAALALITNAIRRNYACRWDEVTLEADPETITAEKAAAWLDAGINRISMGVQSFNDEELRAAGPPRRCLSRHGISARLGISKHQHGFDRGPATPNAGHVGIVR